MARITIEEPISEETESLAEETASQQVENAEAPSALPANPEPAVATEAPKGIPPVHVRRPSSSTAIIAAVAVLVVAILLLLLNDRNSLKKEVTTLRNVGQVKSASDTQEAEQLKSEIGQFLELPADEIPTVATVADASKVKSQSFFANSQNGDKVLLFAKAGKAILYRPSTKKVIEVAPLNPNSTDTQQPGATAPQTPVTPPASTTNRR